MTGAVRPAPSVDDEPVATLSNWGLFASPAGDVRLAGWVLPRGQARVTSPVASFDAENAVVTTASGRTYGLAADSSGPGCEAIVAAWERSHGLPAGTMRRVSAPDLDMPGPTPH